MKNSKVYCIGICLSGNRMAGGMYQYICSLLYALKQLPSQEYMVKGVCLTEGWLSACQSLQIDSYYTENTTNNIQFFLRLITKFSIRLRRKIYSRLDLLDLKKNDIDICIYPVHEAYSYYIEIPSVASIHDLMHRYESEFPEVGEKKEYKARERLFRNIAKFANIILVDSKVGKRQVEESYFQEVTQEKIKILPYIAPDYIYDYLPRIKKNKEDGDKFRYIFYPAQFWKHKNHSNLLKAVKIVKNSFPDIHLLLVGAKKNGYDTVLELIKEYGLKDNVTILGYVHDEKMVDLYKNATALIMPSYFGPTNIPPLEAFHLECPVAAADVYGVSEQVGNAAMLFDPNRPEDIARCICEFWKDNNIREEYILRGKIKDESWGRVQYSQTLENIINELVEEIKND